MSLINSIIQERKCKILFIIYDIKITLKSHFLSKNVIILSLSTQRCYGRHKVSQNLYTTSGLSILLYGVISLPDATSYDKSNLKTCLSRNIF